MILWRDTPRGPEILMGRRHASARFMPGVLVFPGGMVDRADHAAEAASELRAPVRAMLERRAKPSLARALAIAACRELQEETGLSFGSWPGPELAALDYLCRAVTPASRPIRFNARFLIGPGEVATGSLAGSGELDEIAWYPEDAARSGRMAPITALVLDEFHAWHAMPAAARDERDLIVFMGLDRRRPEGA
ncbi:NUDIX hydrolase [Roseomonas arctica]|uniref:NUDIX hydrolase n=1 Tax=Plastoroseomonas arctica TaxID=1509237 RepID=A0AAF1K5E8_9PROT|nr:NUDIX hydrolase [Plastoroseomonas arctica]